jgi:hypothetical protein
MRQLGVSLTSCCPSVRPCTAIRCQTPVLKPVGRWARGCHLTVVKSLSVCAIQRTQ